MIDILMAVYNGEKYIRQQLDSIINQSYQDWQLLIRDDGSDDGTQEIIKEYAEKYSGKIKIIKTDKSGIGAKNNFFELMKCSTSPYIMFSDQDDIWLKEKVKHAHDSILQAEEKYGKDTPLLCHGDLCVVDKDLEVIDSSMAHMQKLDFKKNKLSDYLVQNNVTGCTVIFNKALNSLCRSMPEEAIMHDWWLALVASVFGKVCFMDSTDILYRQHGNNAEGAKNLKSIKYLLKKLTDGEKARKSIQKTYLQAESILKEYGERLNPVQKETVNAYISLSGKGKIDKIKTVRKYGFIKSGFVRRLGHFWFV